MLINVDPLNPANCPDPYRVKEMGFGGVRLVCRAGVEDYVNWCHNHSLFVLGVVARESEGNVLGGICDVYQIGNEPDSPGESSWGMAADHYLEEARIYRETYPDLTLIAAGLTSGNTSYWRTVGPLIEQMGYSGFAVHPYGKNPLQAEALLKRYQAITPGLPLWVTEWHRSADEIPAYRAMLRRIGVAVDAWFCWDYDVWTLQPEQTRALFV